MVLSCQSSDFRGLVSCTLGAIKPLRRLGTGGRDTVVVTSFPHFGEWLRLSPIILLLLCCLVSAVGKVPKPPLLFSLRMEESTPNIGCPMYYPESQCSNHITTEALGRWRVLKRRLYREVEAELWCLLGETAWLDWKGVMKLLWA